MLAYIMDKDGVMGVKVVPEPVATDDNLILKMEAASICGTDFRTYMQGSSKIVRPRILGHECAGTVIHSGMLGREHHIKSGDRVTVAPAIGCGECWPCKTGHTNMCDHLTTLGFQYEGAFAEYIEIPAQAIKMGNVIQIPSNVSAQDAALAEPSACALNAQSYLHIGEGDYVVIYGSGFIGCMHAEFAKMAGAEKIIMVEIAPARAAVAKKMIPDIELINPKEENTAERVMDITGGRGANVVITALSVPSVHTEAQEIASKMGRISLFGGIAGDGKGFLDSNLIHYKELSIHGVHATTAALMQQVLERTASGELNMSKYVSHDIQLAMIEKGFASLRDENAMKVVVH